MEAPKNLEKPRRKIILGLGNPGAEFANTYHNVGALAVKTIAGPLTFKPHKKLFAYAAADDTAFILPLVFMNESGRAAKEALKKFAAQPADLFVLHDESDLSVGEYKISIGRGAAGHKGVQSIIDALGTKEFTRIRIGIRDPKEKRRQKASAFVLQKISPKDMKIFRELFRSL